MFKGIREILALLRSGRVTHQEIFDASLTRMSEIRNLNAFISQTNRKELLPVLKGELPLGGIPFAVKDNYSTVEFPTTCASKMLENYHPPYDATVVKRLKESGAVLMGKTNMDEFAMGSGSTESLFGPVKNPWSPAIYYDKYNNAEDWHIAGGSSGGSAVAVATGACCFAIGSDTGGSVRNPASSCGVVGFKPTYGLISRHGLIPLINSMDVPGIFVRSVEDAAIVLDILKGRDVYDATTVDGAVLEEKLEKNTSVKSLKVGIPKEFAVQGMSQEVTDIWRWAADEFEKAGAQVEEVSLPHVKYSIVCYYVLCCVEVASNMARYDGLKYGHRSAVNNSTHAMFAHTRKEGFFDTVRSRILAGNYFLLKTNIDKYYKKAQQTRRLITQDFDAVFKRSLEHTSVQSKDEPFACDILLSPTLQGDAPVYSEFIAEDNRTRCAEQDILTISANIAGIPAITVPAKLSKRGLPIGLQLAGSRFSETKLLQGASFLEKVASFSNLEYKFLHKTTNLNKSFS